MVEIYECSICNEQFCEHCDPSLICDICNNTICNDCWTPSKGREDYGLIKCNNCSNTKTNGTTVPYGSEKLEFQKQDKSSVTNLDKMLSKIREGLK